MRGQTVWIAERQRIATHIVKPIPSSCQSDRIRLGVPPRLRVVLPETVVLRRAASYLDHPKVLL